MLLLLTGFPATWRHPHSACGRMPAQHPAAFLWGPGRSENGCFEGVLGTDEQLARSKCDGSLSERVVFVRLSCCKSSLHFCRVVSFGGGSFSGDSASAVFAPRVAGDGGLGTRRLAVPRGRRRDGPRARLHGSAAIARWAPLHAYLFVRRGSDAAGRLVDGLARMARRTKSANSP
jgi:hypothetical protein